MYFKHNIHLVLYTFISYSSRFPMTLKISYEQSSWVRGENTSLLVSSSVALLAELVGDIYHEKLELILGLNYPLFMCFLLKLSLSYVIIHHTPTPLHAIVPYYT